MNALTQAVPLSTAWLEIVAGVAVFLIVICGGGIATRLFNSKERT